MWDIKSVILYLVMASIGYFCISEERRSTHNNWIYRGELEK